MLKLGACCGSGLCCALLGGSLWLGGSTTVLHEAAGLVGVTTVGCAKADCTRAGCAKDRAAKAPCAMSFGEGGNCSKYNACSVDRNLMNATGEELERYEAEVALDGVTFSDRVASDFTLPDTAGRRVSLSGYRGENVAVVFLSAHCHHSLDTLPILAELKHKYEGDLTILPVFVNSGDVEDVASRAWELDVKYPLLVSEGKEVSQAYDSRMVPSTFLIDERGHLLRKLVGFKDKDTLDAAFGALTGL